MTSIGEHWAAYRRNVLDGFGLDDAGVVIAYLSYLAGAAEAARRLHDVALSADCLDVADAALALGVEIIEHGQVVQREAEHATTP